MAIQEENPNQRDFDNDVPEHPRLPNHILIGDEYLTVGGWKARVVHITANRFWFYAIHKPEDPTEESHPIMHDTAGKATPVFSVSNPPSYDSPLPADILLDKKISN